MSFRQAHLSILVRSLVQPCWLSLFTSFSTHMDSRRICSMILSGTEVKLAYNSFRPSLYPFSKVWVVLFLFQSMENSPDCKDYSNMQMVALPLPLPVLSGPSDASYQVPRTCTSPGSLDSLRTDPLLHQMVLHYPCPWFCLPQLGWCGRSTYWWELRKKKLLSTSALFLFWVTRPLIFFREGLYCPWSFHH